MFAGRPLKPSGFTSSTPTVGSFAVGCCLDSAAGFVSTCAASDSTWTASNSDELQLLNKTIANTTAADHAIFDCEKVILKFIV